MDILSISNASLLQQEQLSSARQKRAEKQAGQEQTAQDQPQEIQAQNLHDHRKIDPKVFVDLHGLSLSEARTMLAGLTETIKESSPWSLAELQPVSDRTLIPAAYV